MTPEDLQFADLAVAQGLCTRAQVEECIALVERLTAEGVVPLPRLGELLARKGYLTPAASEATLKAASSSSGGTKTRTAEMPGPAAEAARDPANRVGKYVKVATLGAGGMGEVWKAWDGELARWVALKFMKTDDPGEQARFIREAQTAAALNHPNIAAVYESGQAGGKPYLAMQFVDGPTLATVPRNDVRPLVTLLRDAALAVHHAHEKRVVHRDLKPANLMVEGSRVYVMDFGLAKQTSVDSSLSVSGAILGTPAYMAPEQARGDAARVGPRSDVYSLGVTLYELLADRPPFQDTEVYALLKRVVEEDPVPLRRRAPRVDRDLETIVMKCLEKDPDRRYGSAREIAEDLDRWLGGHAILAHPPSALYKLRKFAGRRKAVLGLASAAVLAVAVLLPGWIREREERRVLSQLSELRSRILVVKEWYRQPFRKPREIRDALAREVREISRFIEAHPNLPQGYYVRAHAFMLQDRYRPAQQDLREAIRLEPSFSPAWTLLARVLYDEYEARRDGITPQERQANRRAALPLLEEARKAISRGWKEGGDKASLERWGLVRTSEDFVAEKLAQMLSEHHLDNQPDRSRRTLRDAQRDVPSEEFCRWLALMVSDPEEKRRWHDQAVAIAPNAPSVWFHRGRYLLGLQKFDEALADFDVGLAADPDSVPGYLDRTATLLRKGEAARALADCERAVALDPRSAHVRSTKAAVHLRLNDMAGAEREAEEAIRVEPANPLSWVNRSSVRLRKGDYDGAEADAARSIDLDPSFSFGWANRAAARWERGDAEGASRDVEKSLSLEEPPPAAYATRAAVKMSRGDLAGAEADASRAIELDPGDFMGHMNRGAARANRGDLEGALADTNRAIALDPGAALAYSNRGFIALRKGDWDAALPDLGRAIELNPRLDLAYINRSTGRLMRQDYPGALADAERAVELKPSQASAWAVRAQAYAALNQPEKALADISKSLELDPKIPEHYVVRATARRLLKRPGEAIADYEEALRRAPAGWPLKEQVLAWMEETKKERP